LIGCWLGFGSYAVGIGIGSMDKFDIVIKVKIKRGNNTKFPSKNNPIKA